MGSGKSSLLSAIIAEMEYLGGSMHLQQPFNGLLALIMFAKWMLVVAVLIVL